MLELEIMYRLFYVGLNSLFGICSFLKQEGASDEDIRQLPKYKFRRIGDPEKIGGDISRPSGGIMTECGSDPPIEHVLSAEDVVGSLV